MSKDDASKHFNTTRTTLRKWTAIHDLGHIRFIENTHKGIKATSSNGVVTKYNSIKEFKMDH